VAEGDVVEVDEAFALFVPDLVAGIAGSGDSLMPSAYWVPA